MAREDLHFRLRIPEQLKKRIEAAASKNRRSTTAEIVAALEGAYPEGMSMGDFIERWVMPITRAETEEEKDRLVSEANAAAETANGAYRARTAKGSDGLHTIDVFLVDGDDRTRVALWTPFGT